MVFVHENEGVCTRVPPASPGTSVLMNNKDTTLSHRKISNTLDEIEKNHSPSRTAVGTVGHDDGDTSEWRKDLRTIGVCLVVSFTMLLLFLSCVVFGPLDPAQRQALRFPTSLESAQALGTMLSEYANEYRFRLLAGHCACYLFLQTFAIPGTVFFNLLGGALFGMFLGFPLCLVYNTLGSVFLYWLSKHLGRRVVMHYFPHRLKSLHAMLQDHRGELVVYMMFLRIFPFTPNWFMNVASPHLNISVTQFATAVFFGLIPYNFLSCKAGLILSELRSKNDIMDVTTTCQLIAVAVIGFIALPRLKKRFA